MKRICAMVLSLGLLAGCGTSGEKVTDFSNRSVGYGWLNIKDVDANRLHKVLIFQHRPQTKEPYYHAGLKEFKGGHLYYSIILPPGAFKTYSASGQRCLGILCGNTIYTYSFGRQGDDVGAIQVREPGVFHMGSYDLKDVKTGFFEAGKFDVVPAAQAPSQRELLEELLRTEGISDNPVMADRIRQALARLK